MNQELKNITIRSLIENLAINNKFLTSKDLELLKEKFVNSNKRLKDIENQINYEITKLEKKNHQNEKRLKKQEEKKQRREEETEEGDIEEEYTLFTYESIGISSSKKVKIKQLHLGKENIKKTSYVIINDDIKGYLKLKDNRLVDDVDLAVSQIGKLLGVCVTDIYRVEDAKHNKGILSIDIKNKNIIEHKTLGSIINSHYNKVLMSNSYPNWIKELISLPDSNKERVITDEVSLKTLIDLGYTIVFEEYKTMSEEEKENYKKQYFEMLIFDYLTNQLDRNSENFGISITKENKVILSPLYDNGCVVDFENLNEGSTRFMMKICDKTALIYVLFKYYFDDIKDFVFKIIHSKSTQEKIEEIVNTYLDENDALWYKGVIDLNMKMMKKLYKEKTELKKKNLNSSGYTTTVQQSILVVICSIILGVVIGLFFVIKTK